jgi:hypothetical protein
MFKELFGWWSSAMRREGQAGAVANVANRITGGIARRDVIRRFIAEPIHAAAPEGKVEETFITTPVMYASDGVPSPLRQQPKAPSQKLYPSSRSTGTGIAAFVMENDDPAGAGDVRGGVGAARSPAVAPPALVCGWVGPIPLLPRWSAGRARAVSDPVGSADR